MNKGLYRAVCAVAAAALAFPLAACGSGGGDTGASGITADDVQAALDSDEDITLTVWTWAYDIRKKSTDAFMKKYPHIKIDLVSTGTSSDHYTKFQNVVKAGSGIPDIVQTDYDSMPQYAATGSLANISEESIEKEFGSLYADAAWNAVHMGDGLYGIPSDQAPVAMYVRADILEEYGIDVPTTWDEFEEAGKKLHEADPTKYMGVFDTSNAHFMDYFFRAAGVKTYSVDGTENVSFDMQNDETKGVMERIQRMIDEGVIEATATGTDQFTRDFLDGRYATWIDGCWRGALIASNMPSLEGKMTVELPPAYGDSSADLKTATIGGSMLAMTSACPKEKRAAAIAYMNWVSSDPDAIEAWRSYGGSYFNAAKSFQTDSEQANITDDFFRGEKVKAVYFESASKINDDWDVLPFNSQYAQEFVDTVVPELTEDGDLYNALGKWQSNLETYAEDQGFNVVDK